VSTTIGKNHKISNLIKISYAVLCSHMPRDSFTVSDALTCAGLPVRNTKEQDYKICVKDS